MRTPLAVRNLAHNWTRTIAAVGGVTFAVVLIFTQFGFWGAALTTATIIYDKFDYDILLRSPRYVQFGSAKTFSLRRLNNAKNVAGVKSVAPVYVSLSRWRKPDSIREAEDTSFSRFLPELARAQPILMVGINPQQSAFNRRYTELAEKSKLLTSPQYVLIDRQSTIDFGPADEKEFGPKDVHRETEIGGRRVRIVGHIDMGAGLMASGSVVVSDQGLCRLTPGRTLDDVSLGLVTLEPGASPEKVAERINRELAGEVVAVTKAAVENEEKDFWVYKTPVGMIFLAAAMVALIVGVVVVYQVLTSDIAHQLSEYATLKAMGYTNSFLRFTVLQQACLLAVMGFIVGGVLSWILYGYIRAQTNVPIAMQAPRAVLVFSLTLVMCLISGVLSVRKLQGADPADLFR